MTVPAATDYNDSILQFMNTKFQFIHEQLSCCIADN